MLPLCFLRTRTVIVQCLQHATRAVHMHTLNRMAVQRHHAFFGNLYCVVSLKKYYTKWPCLYIYVIKRSNFFFFTAVSADDMETAAAIAAVELQKPCETITPRPVNSNFDNGEGNAFFIRYVYTHTYIRTDLACQYNTLLLQSVKNVCHKNVENPLRLLQQQYRFTICINM